MDIHQHDAETARGVATLFEPKFCHVMSLVAALLHMQRLARPAA